MFMILSATVVWADTEERRVQEESAVFPATPCCWEATITAREEVSGGRGGF